jgi:RNA polymerase sigma-70 factor (ECF subfamily)
MGSTTEDALAAEFTTYRSHLLGVAYRVLSSRADAEDVVQNAWLRLRRVDRAAIGDLRGRLTTVTARLCLDQLRSARVRRESYVGPWLGSVGSWYQPLRGPATGPAGRTRRPPRGLPDRRLR